MSLHPNVLRAAACGLPLAAATVLSACGTTSPDASASNNSNNVTWEDTHPANEPEDEFIQHVYLDSTAPIDGSSATKDYSAGEMPKKTGRVIMSMQFHANGSADILTTDDSGLMLDEALHCEGQDLVDYPEGSRSVTVTFDQNPSCPGPLTADKAAALQQFFQVDTPKNEPVAAIIDLSD